MEINILDIFFLRFLVEWPVIKQHSLCIIKLYFTPNFCVTDPEEICTLEYDVGPCKAAYPRYYYDPEEKWCKKFIYGGCKGNANNFETFESCMQFCNGV